MFDVTESPSVQKSSGSEPQRGEPKSWFVDPYALIDHLGLGYRASPTTISFETLRNMGEKEPICSSIINTRVHQAESFCQIQPNKYSIGMEVGLRNRREKPSKDDKKAMNFFETLIMNSGRRYNRGRDGMAPFVKKIIRDSLTYDQVTVETVRNSWGHIIDYFAVPARSIRIAAPKNKKGTPLERSELKDLLRYVQLNEGAIVTEYTDDELIFAVRNPRTDMEVFGYGFSELEMLMRIVTALLWGVDWNIKSFSQGATIKGILNMKGNISTPQFEAFKRQWVMQTAGVQNAWKTPMINTDGVEWVPLQLSNQEMGYSQWLDWLTKVACAVFLIDPAEINFDLRGGSGGSQPMFMSPNEAQQKVSKDRGLRPLLNFVADIYNRYVIWPEDPRFEVRFVGLDAKTEEQAIELRLKQVQVKTLNEVRREDDLPPVPHGDVVLNSTYTGYLQAKAQMAQQQPPGGGGPPGMGGGGPPQPGAGMPGGGGGMPGQQPQPGQPREAYPEKFKDHDFESEERSAAGKMEREAESRDEETVVGPHSSSSNSSHAPDKEDWETTIRASLRDNKIIKSLRRGKKRKRNRFEPLDV